MKISKLNNGFTIIEIPQRETKAVTVLIVVKTGSRYERKNINGISHFIEHLMFKGTKKRPDTLTLSKELDKVGAEFNAFTSKDMTAYYIKVNAENLELALDMLSDMLFSSLFNGKEIDRERGVITEEINMYEDNPLLYCEDLLEKLLYRQNHPLGQLISGSKQNIKNISRNQIFKFYQQYYFPGNIIISVAGRINKNINELLKKYFESIKISSKKNCRFEKFKPYQKKSQILIFHKKTEQIQFGLAFPGLPYKHKNLPALDLLSIILGGNMSSRLFINIRERQGLCYYIKCDATVYQDTGALIIRAGLDKKRIKEAVAAIKNELIAIKKNGVTLEELNKAQNYLKGKLVLDLEDSAAQASWYAKQKLLYNSLISPEERLKKYLKVTKKQIQAVANDIVNFAKANLVFIGPYSKKEENRFIKIIKN